MPSGLLIILCGSSFLAALGQVLFKIGASGRETVIGFLNLHILVGLLSYGVGVMIWLYGLSRAPLYLVYPFSLLTFVLVGAASVFWFGERPNLISIVGWFTIIAGIGLVYLGSIRPL